MSPSTLASAYRPTTHFTRRDDGGRASRADAPSEPCVSLSRLSGQGALDAAQSSPLVRAASECTPVSPLGLRPWPLYLFPLQPTAAIWKSISLQKSCNSIRFCLGKHQPVPRQAAAKGSLLEGKRRFEAGERTNPLRLIIELCALRSR